MIFRIKNYKDLVDCFVIRGEVANLRPNQARIVGESMPNLTQIWGESNANQMRIYAESTTIRL